MEPWELQIKADAFEDRQEAEALQDRILAYHVGLCNRLAWAEEYPDFDEIFRTAEDVKLDDEALDAEIEAKGLKARDW